MVASVDFLAGSGQAGQFRPDGIAGKFNFALDFRAR